jgi:prepilin-type N-terminal cleavage/methylation domain-containing protein
MNYFWLYIKNLIHSLFEDKGMSVTELMVSICILSVVASAAVPCYISSVQQGRVVALILPRLQMVEASVSLFYILNGRLPYSDDINEVLEDLDSENLDIALSAGAISLTIRAPDKTSKLNILDGKILLASPVISGNGVVSWHLNGELADRLQINY